MATNSADVLEIIRARTGVKVEVISGDEEGRLAYLAVRAGLPSATGRLVVFDTGGGSSQFTFGEGDHVSERFSVNVGAVRYTERYGLDGAVSSDVLREAMKAIAEDLSRIADRPSARDAGRHGRRRDQPDGGELRDGQVRSRHDPGHRAHAQRD